MVNPIVEFAELEDASWSDSDSSSLGTPREASLVPNPILPGEAPPVPNPIPPPYRKVLSSEPQATPSAPPAPPRIPYLTRPGNGISINVDSKQINSVRPYYLSSDPRTNMINGNAVALLPNRDSTSISKVEPPVPSAPSLDSGSFPGNSISISVKARQFNSVGLLNSLLFDSACRKELDTVNQGVLASAPCQTAAPVPIEPSPPERECIYSATREQPPVVLTQECVPREPPPVVIAQECVPREPSLAAFAEECVPREPPPVVSPQELLRQPSPATVSKGYLPGDGIRSPQRAPQQHASPVPTVPPRGGHECVYLPSPVNRLPEVNAAVFREPSPESSFSRVVIASEARAASPVPTLQPRDQDVFSLPSRVASPVCVIPRTVSPSHSQAPQIELPPAPLIPCPNPTEVIVNDPPAPSISCRCACQCSCRCPCLHGVQRSGCPVSLVQCQNLASNPREARGNVPLVSCSRSYARQGNEATNLAPAAQEVQASLPLASCSGLYACQRTQATVPLVTHINPQEANDTDAPIICQGDILNNKPINKPIHSVGLSDPILSDTRRKKLDILNRLHSLGIQRDIGLPSIVVVGSQGVGKSSFIESISGVNLPRSSGTCTRCPIECRLVRTASSELWQCTVTLRFLTDERGRPLDVARNTTFGNTMNDPNEVEERLRRAQLAILNPSIPPEMLLDDNVRVEHNSNSFSSNIISLEIKSPDVTDLSFYDLPGLIASVSDGGRDEDVESIHELILAYIRQQNCIILLTVTCEVDFETQGAYRLAKKCDPEGIRTIGVLTKPDRIPEGEHYRWFRLLRNEISPLRHGWFCVKQLSTMELQRGYSFEKARRFCKSFFKSVPWDTLDPALYRKRLGTKAVMIKLNELLVSVISERIPEIIQELLKLIRDTKDQIQALPVSPSSNPVFELVLLINRFCDALYSRPGEVYVNGIDNCEGFVPLLGNIYEGIRGAQEKFRKAICETAPKFQPYPRNAKLKFHLPCELATEVVTGSTAETMYLDDVSAMAKRAVTIELPGFYPFHVVQDLITCFTNKWKTPALNLINEIFHIVMERQMRILTFYFEKYTSGGLYHAVKDLVYEHMQTRKEILSKHVESIIRLESTAFTLNNPVFRKYRSDRSEKHERIRQAYGNFDEDDSALNIITSVEAYFQVAHQRFIDNVPLAIDHKLVRVKKTSLQKVLYRRLDLMGSNSLENCATLMVANIQHSDLRAELEERLERLEAVQTELLDLN